MIKRFDKSKDESETVIVGKKDKDNRGRGIAIDMKPYITRIDIIYNDMFWKDEDMMSQFEYLSKINIPIFIQYETWNSVHEFRIKQNNKSQYMSVSGTIDKELSKTKLSAESQVIFNELKDTLQEYNKEQKYEFVYNIALKYKDLNIGRAVDNAEKFKSLEEMSNKLVVLSKFSDAKCRALKYKDYYIAYKIN